MKSMNYFFILVLLSALGILNAGTSSGIKYQGNFVDTAFNIPSSLHTAPIRLEVLESGDTTHVYFNQPFTVLLPQDTAWNLCFRRDDLEKCYLLEYHGKDSTFAATLGANGLVVANALNPDSSASTLDPIDSAANSNASDAALKSEEAVQLKKVLVRAQRTPKRALGKSTVSAKLIKRMPGLAEADVMRSIQGLPGVVSSSDFSTKIYVRGGGADQNLILLDKAVVYSPVHFFGLFSTFLVEGIDDVTFYKGGFPPEYGNRLSSVLDIKSRKGGEDTVESWTKSSIKISTFATQIHNEGHEGKLRWLLAGRGTYIKEIIDQLRHAGITDLNLNYFFYDGQGNLQYTFNKEQQSMLSFYTGRDKLDFSPFTVEWGNTIIPFNYTNKISDNMSLQTTASYSLFSQTFALQNIFSFYNRIETYMLKPVFEYTGIENHRLTTGLELNWLNTDFTNNQVIAKVKETDITSFSLSSFFLQDKWSLNSTEITTGLRSNYESAINKIGLEPRFSLKQKLPYDQSLDFHTGYYLQYVNSIQFGDFETINEFYYPSKKVKYQTIQPTSSLLFSLGYGKEKLFNQFDFTLEGYYKTLNNLLVFSPNDVPDSVLKDPQSSLGDKFIKAEGYSYGFETSLRRPEGLLFGGLSYSHGYSVSIEEGNPTAYYPKWHQPHSFKGDLAINWKGKDGMWASNIKGRYFRSSMQIKYATGLPYTEVIGYLPTHLQDQNQGKQAGGPNPEFNDNVSLIKSNRNMAFVPPYFRWDIKAVDWGREGKWNFSWTILNITNHENVFLYFYNTQKNPPALLKVTQFPFFPVLVNYEYYF